MKWGDKLDVLRRHKKSTGRTPSALRNMPDLPKYLQWYFTAWQRLSQSRGSGMGGPSPIPLSEIKSYCEIQGIQDNEQVCQVIDYIQQIDSVFIQHHQPEVDEDAESDA